MGAADCSRMNTMREITRSDADATHQTTLAGYKYHLLAAVYVLGTGLAFARVRRQPYSQSMKMEQYETIVKGTTLAAVVGGVAIGGGLNQARSAERRPEQARTVDKARGDGRDRENGAERGV